MPSVAGRLVVRQSWHGAWYKRVYMWFLIIRGSRDVWIWWFQKGGVVYRQKKGRRKRAVSAQCEVRLKMATAGLRQISRSCAWRLSRVTKFVFCIPGRPDVDVGRRRAVDRPKTSTASKATLIICLRTKLVASSPICKSSVVDFVDLVMSRDHRNNNAVWLSRVKTNTQKKVKQQKVRSRAHLNRLPFAPKSAVYHLGYLGIDECEQKKHPLNHVGDRHGVLDSRSGKEGVVRLNKSKFSLFCLPNENRSAWTCWRSIVWPH